MPPRDPFTPTTTPTLDPVEGITRRRLLTALPALGLIAGGISCGDDDDEPAPTEAPTEAPSTRVVEHPLGTTELPMQPARPLDASWASDVVEVAAELSIALVGMRYVEYYTTAFSEATEGVDEIPPSVDDESYELDLELMLTLNPDVLIVSSGQEEDYERLTAAGLPVVSYNYNASWRERAQRVAELLGRPGALDDLIAELDERIDALTERAEGLSAAIVDFRGAEDIRVWAGPQNNRLSAYAVLDEIGLRPGEEIRSLKNEFDQTVLSLEQLRLIDTDYIYVFSAEAGDAAVNDENLRELVSSPLWESLPAVQAGNVHLVSTAWFGDSIRSVRTIIGDLEQTLPA